MKNVKLSSLKGIFNTNLQTLFMDSNYGIITYRLANMDSSISNDRQR